MSMQHVAYVLNELHHLSASDTLVLVALADAADPEYGQCWPSVGYIAKVARCSRRTVQYALARLEENGWIHSKLRNGSSLYTLLFDRNGAQISYEEHLERRKMGRQRERAADEAEGGRNSCTPRTERGATAARGGATVARGGATVARGGATVAHMNQSLNQSLNQKDARAREAPSETATRERAKSKDPHVDPLTGAWLGDKAQPTEKHGAIAEMLKRARRRDDDDEAAA